MFTCLRSLIGFNKFGEANDPCASLAPPMIAYPLNLPVLSLIISKLFESWLTKSSTYLRRLLSYLMSSTKLKPIITSAIKHIFNEVKYLAQKYSLKIAFLKLVNGLHELLSCRTPSIVYVEASSMICDRGADFEKKSVLLIKCQGKFSELFTKLFS